MWVYNTVSIERCKEEGVKFWQRDSLKSHSPSSVGRRRGHDFKTSHIADTWRYAGTLCLYVCVCVGRERKKEGGRHSCQPHRFCPRALWVITERHGSSTNYASLELTRWQKRRRWDLLLSLCHCGSRLIIVNFYCPAFGFWPKRAREGQQCSLWPQLVLI